MLTPAFNRGKSQHGILIHPTGSAGGAIRDESPYARTVTAYGGGAVISSGPFGLALKCRNATSDYYGIAYSAAAHYLGAGDFAIGCRANFYDCRYSTFFMCQWQGESDFVYLGKASSTDNHQMEFRVRQGGTDVALYRSGNLSFSDGRDYCFEVARSGTSVYLLINGVDMGLNAVTPIGSTTITVAGNWELNLCRNDTRFGDFKMSEIYLIKGHAPHTANYSPPTRRI